MTAADRHLQIIARQQLGHVPVESIETYIRADATSVLKCTEGIERVVVQRLKHLPVELSELYVSTYAAAAFEYAHSGAITVVDAVRPADEGEVTL